MATTTDIYDYLIDRVNEVITLTTTRGVKYTGTYVGQKFGGYVRLAGDTVAERPTETTDCPHGKVLFVGDIATWG